jgi:carbon-monoxide dehydrogenase iron sulfur subunit
MSKTSSVELCRLHWEPTRCSNCLSCVVVCSERHTGTSTPSRSLIHIRVGLFDGSQSAEYCRQCDDAPCVAACAVEAIALDAERRFWRVDDAQCIACGECVDACPYHAIHLDVETGVAAKCDLCLGATRCIEICPTQALTLECSRED